jgi:ABC-type lipoprotein release transport system permease subunit
MGKAPRARGSRITTSTTLPSAAKLTRLAIGLATAAAVTRLVMATLYEVGPVDPLTYAAVTAGLLGVAALASYVPARRASTVDPAESLAAE